MALGYKVALTNVWWNRGGQDTRRDVEGAVPYKEDLFFGFLP